ncbi:MAG: CvpA family protein [Gammaproteobacteria bacterium]|nr:CvpA family protein [Gammaproteobacteria bacterium]
MTWLDGLLLLVVAISALYGVLRGFVREVLSLVGWVVSAWLAIRYAPWAANHLASLIPGAGLRYLVAFAVLCGTTLVASAIIARLVSHLVTLGGLGGIDRLAGVVFGALRGMVMAMLLLAVFDMTPLTLDPVWQQSHAVALFEPLWHWAIEATPLQDQLAVYRGMLWQ